MGKKKVISVIVFVAIAMVSGGIVSIYVNKGSVDVKGAAHVESADAEQAENEKTAQAETESAVQADKVTFSCGVSGCTETEAHMHGGEYCYPHSADDGHAYHNCGVSDCTVETAHTHGNCGIDGCTQTGEHSHGGNSGGHHQSGHGGGHH